MASGSNGYGDWTPTRLSQWRLDQTPRMSQKTLAKRLKYTPSLISKLEAGKAEPAKK